MADKYSVGGGFGGGLQQNSSSGNSSSASTDSTGSHKQSQNSTVMKTVGTAVLGGLLGKMFSKVTGENKQDYSMEGAPIDIPGTLMGNLKNVQGTKQYLDNFARYNNYLTCNLGMAQMASDRYMSIKERIPMSFEYYENPKRKKEVVMYINPENMTISTSKVKQKVYTRGGIYFHHYGDDVWSMKISGTVGYAQMRGIEALEEIYFHSGALLKYNNIAVDTVHTNKITSYTGASDATIANRLEELRSSGPIGNYLAKVIGTGTDALGYTKGKDGKTDNSLVTKFGKNGGILGKIFGGKSSEKSGGNLFKALAGASGNLQNDINNRNKRTKAGGVSRKEVQTLMAAGALITGYPTAAKAGYNALFKNLKQTMGGFTSGNILGAMAADMQQTMSSGKTSTDNMKDLMNSLNDGTKDFFQGTLDILTGHQSDGTGSSSITAPSSAINGNYYSFDINSRMDLNNVVKSVASFGADHTIDKKQAFNEYKDLEGDLTDLYRPRQIIMYFDDRVYIGHFDSFNYSRKATTPLIYYDMQLTITRQIRITPKQSKKQNKKPLAEMLGMMVAGEVFGGYGNGSSEGTATKDNDNKKTNNNKKQETTKQEVTEKPYIIDKALDLEYRAQEAYRMGNTSQGNVLHDMAHEEYMLDPNVVGNLNYTKNNVDTADKALDTAYRAKYGNRDYDLHKRYVNP